MINEIATALGHPLFRNGEFWEIDLSRLRVFRGLSVLSNILGDETIEQVENRPGDVSILYKINPGINPELVDMHFTYIQIYSRAGLLNDILGFRSEFQDHLRIVFGTFQNVIWAKKLHPEFYGEDPKKFSSFALVFPYHHVSENEDINYQFILERVESLRQRGDFYLRLTIENFASANLNLNSIPHVVVDDLQSRIYIEGATRIAESINNGILSACQRGQKSFLEEKRIYSQIFDQVARTSLGRLDQINFSWDDHFSHYITHTDPSVSILLIKKLLLAIEDNKICSLLKEGNIILIHLGRAKVYMDLSRLDRVLNFSFNAIRTSITAEFYLKRMPELHSIAIGENHNLSFAGVKIFLIHHITSEIIALIEAFRKLSVEDLCVTFVKYGGVVPPVYLDVLLDIPSEKLFMTGLERKVTKENQDYYSMANIYSDVSQLHELHKIMEEQTLGFFDAMKLLSGHLFLLFCLDARKKNKKVLLVEDGGYVAPFINEFSLQGKSIKEVFARYFINEKIADFSVEDSFQNFLQSVFIGSIEHTRNGYDRLENVVKQFTKLHAPVFSIALSDKKVKEESKEVARSILNAIESILSGQGKVLSTRKLMLLGAEGNIGKYTADYLHTRLEDQTVIKVDLKYNESDKYSSAFGYIKMDDIPDDLLLSRDLFLGVIGESIMEDRHLEKILLGSKENNIYFVSGSTKTMEFTHLINWLKKLVSMENPHIGNKLVEINYDRIIDPQSRIDQGAKVTFKSADFDKSFYLFSDLSPINFLYYGVPTESMDVIISQLTTVSLGMTEQMRKNNLPPSLLYAVDAEIDSWGNLR